ncbi:PEP-CTERM sorting domain-containing protein [bacterium]|nr:MAG: PEP-CTERM sorting domain-containing protein [bacterium]
MQKLIFAALASLVAAAGHAQISTTGVFTGSLNEGFEGFNNYNQGSTYLSNPTSIMGGAASLTSTWGVVYQPGPAGFGLGGRGMATVSNGSKAFGLNTSVGVTSLTFSQSISQFGGYFNHDSSGNGVKFRFYDENDAQIGSDMFSTIPFGNQMTFVGFDSTVGIKRVEYSGSYVVADGLRANVQAVPEPASMAALGLGALGMWKRRKRNA